MAEQSLVFEKFRVWEVVVPARQDIISAPPSANALYKDNLTWPQLPIHLVEGTTSAGFTAVGESGRGASRAVVEATLHDLLGRNLLATAPATIWMGSADASGLPQSYPLWSWQTQHNKSYQLMESLWVDAVAKAGGMPAHLLFGGAVRHAVVTDFWANRPGPATLAALVHEANERGLRGMKMKCDGSGDTVHALAAVAQDVPDGFHFTIDPMLAWRTLRESARLFEQLERLPFAVQIEDPFPYNVADDWRRARQMSHLTIICHARDETVLEWALREGTADALNVGGEDVSGFFHMANVAEFHGKDCWLGSSLELGVLQHLRLHGAACARNCVLASDLQSEWVREHTLITPRMQYAGGCALVPDRPGLGVELDHDAVARYRRGEFSIP